MQSATQLPAGQPYLLKDLVPRGFLTVIVGFSPDLYCHRRFVALFQGACFYSGRSPESEEPHTDDLDILEE